VDFYRKSDGGTKKKILGCIFPGKLVLEKGKVLTTPFTLPIHLILRISEVLGSSKKKKEVENDLLSCLVPLTVESCNALKDLLMLKQLRLQYSPTYTST
jgi:hypothetical protein